MTDHTPPTSPSTSKVSASDRLGFTLFIALALHAVFILGSNFIDDNTPPPTQSLEITLAQYQAKKAPEKADFLAQHNQEGSGTVEERKLTSTTERSNFQDNIIRNQAALPTPSTAEPIPVSNIQNKAAVKETQNQANSKQQPKREVVTTTTKQKTKTNKTPRKKPTQSAPKVTGQSTSLLARSLEIANLQAQIRLQKEELSRLPKKRRLSSVSTAQHDDAVYLDNWRKRIEKIGNKKYPEEARRKKLYGTLRMAVSIRPDGSLEDVEILKSSGHKVLDDAAIRIVRLAAPFQPFSVEMRKTTDILEIIRTWKFEKNTRVY